jgi:LAS superfamily LD-carboxypeptidase LdcB
MQLSFQEKKYARVIIAFFINKIRKTDTAAAIRLKDLKAGVSKSSHQLAKGFYDLDPQNFGINRPFCGHQPKTNLIQLAHQRFTLGNKYEKIPTRLVPKRTYRDFQRLNHHMKKQIDRTLVIQSGYRSPTYQLFLFLYNLQANNWDTKRTLSTVALPGYSEHGSARQAIDLKPRHTDLPAGEYDFSKTQEYEWLLWHANDFGFTLSYPEGNVTGTDFEPWHWRHVKSTM